MKNDKGFYLIGRGIFGHPALRDIAEEAAFIWMVGRAAWKPTRIRYKDKPHHLKRGELAISLRDLANGLHWSIGATQRFINRLRAESMIDTRTDSGVIIVKLCNYAAFQDAPKASDSPSDSPPDSKVIQSRVTEQTSKQINKDSLPLAEAKRATRIPKDWTAPAIAELSPEAKRCAESWPAGDYSREAEAFREYWTGTGKPMIDWTATWRGWILREHKRRFASRRDAPSPESNWRSLIRTN
jgi:hypothetical protein